MESDELLETLAYLAVIGVLPYVAVEIFEMAQRAIMRRRNTPRH